jgi:hypothetical protein
MSLNKLFASNSKRKCKDDIALREFNSKWEEEFLFVKGVSCRVRDTEFRASVFCHFKKLRCKSLFIVNVTFKSQILKFIFYSRQSHVSQNRRK